MTLARRLTTGIRRAVCALAGELEDIFCQVDGNDRSIHIGLLLVRAFAETPHMLSLAH
jgi:hypothetical protein